MSVGAPAGTASVGQWEMLSAHGGDMLSARGGDVDLDQFDMRSIGSAGDLRSLGQPMDQSMFEIESVMGKKRKHADADEEYWSCDDED